MAQMLEIRWHGRGGQGAKTAAILLGEAASSVGKYIQAFPEYGPERMGAPVLAFNRISDEPVRVHCHVSNPRIVVVLDPTLIGKNDVTSGVPEDGIYLVNTNLTPAEMRAKLKVKGGKVYTVDATQISIDTIGRAIPNTPMMGALLRATGLMSLEEFVADTRHKLEMKFRSKPEVIGGNIKAIERAYQEVQSE
ncbi:MAG: 2-oxoacid:acceptor oxidoreductase family protein [Bacillota bacterium]|nr:2-oxoacid:acceptor oxidoreductase family protein [Bacillota bacterium]